MKSLFLTALFSLFGFLPSSHAVEGADLEKIVKSYRIPRERLGIHVVDLNEIPHKTVYALNPDEAMIPASVSKVFTAIAALKRFGPSYRMTTALWSDARIEKGNLKGNLYLKGGGDPGFVSETMWFLVNEFTRNEVVQVDGDIVVDESLFDNVRFDESRDPGRVDRAYDAPIGAMSFNWNSINVHVRPTKAGSPPKVFLNPENGEWTVSNKAKTVKGGKSSILVSRVEANGVYVSGSIGESVGEAVQYKSILAPAMWAGNGLKLFLAQRGIAVKGSVRVGVLPKDARVLAEAKGKPMNESVSDMMKFSNNYVAEMLTKNLAAEYVKQPATMKDGVDEIVKVLTQMGVSKKDFVFVNPSGLSRQNKFKAKDINHLLAQAHGDFAYSAEFLASLPLAGVDGTLKTRMNNTPAQGRVRAKTGMLTGVASLAGFAGREDGRLYAFTLIFNGPGEQGDLARRMFDDMAARMVK